MKTPGTIFFFRRAAGSMSAGAAQGASLAASIGAPVHAGVDAGDISARARGRYGRQAVAAALMILITPLSVGDLFAQNAPPPPPDYGQQQAPPPGYDQQQGYPQQQGPGPDQQGYGPQEQGYGPPQGGQAYQALAPEQINQMVAPIALYPDSLVAQILAGATYPAQLSAAEQLVRSLSGAPPEQIAQTADQQPWDPSVKALTAFPQVLDNMNQNMQWTTQLGNVYFNQPQDVLSAVQEMRQRAYASGNLRPSQQLNVEYAPGNIVIAPYNPAVVYVPYYNPWGVYGAPIAPYGYYHYYGPPRGVALGVGLAVGFGVGIAIGAFTHFGWGFHSWAPDWHSRTVNFNRNVYISRSVTVINHGRYGGYDRNPQARAFNQGQAAHFNAVNHGGPGGFNHGGPGGFDHGGNAGNFNHSGGPGGFNNSRPGQFNNTNRPAQDMNGARPAQGNFNNGGARPVQGNFNNGGARPPQGGFNNGGARPGQPSGAQHASGQPENHGGGGQPQHSQPSQGSHESHGGGEHESHSGGGGHESHGGGHDRK